jgi:hypothetical protein
MLWQVLTMARAKNPLPNDSAVGRNFARTPWRPEEAANLASNVFMINKTCTDVLCQSCVAFKRALVPHAVRFTLLLACPHYGHRCCTGKTESM